MIKTLTLHSGNHTTRWDFILAALRHHAKCRTLSSPLPSH
jgi:hypothetical protein